LQKIERDTNSYLKLFADFSDFAGEKYLQEVETDCTRFSPGLTLLENLIRTIGSVSEIEQTKSNRALNTTLTAAAIGFALVVLVVGYSLLVIGC
jgi:hypothetical protein